MTKMMHRTAGRTNAETNVRTIAANMIIVATSRTGFHIIFHCVAKPLGHVSIAGGTQV